MQTMLKLPTVVRMSEEGVQEFVNEIIETHGKTHRVNEMALTIYCKDHKGLPFELVQFHGEQDLIHILNSVN